MMFEVKSFIINTAIFHFKKIWF